MPCRWVDSSEPWNPGKSAPSTATRSATAPIVSAFAATTRRNCRNRADETRHSAGATDAESTISIVPHGHDVYGRTLADVFVNGQNVADVMTREGYGKERVKLVLVRQFTTRPTGKEALYTFSPRSWFPVSRNKTVLALGQ